MDKKILMMTMGIAYLFILGCSKEEADNTNQSSLPKTFRIDVPSSISNSSTQKSTSTEVISGNEVYEHLNNFIYIGDASAEIVEDIIKAIRIYGLNKPMQLSFNSEEDGRTKNLVVLDNSTFEGSLWQHQITITDAASENDEDGGIGMQVFWNTNPTVGIAILRPYHWNRTETANMDSTIFRVDYSEAENTDYEATMVVSINQWDLTISDRFHMDNLKMFVGKSGDRVDVYGNSNHPDAWLFLAEPVGFNWAFVASGSIAKNIGVAEVGLPLSSIDETSREVLLETYSMNNVFTSQIREYVFQNYGVYPDAATINSYLVNTEAPGFFNSNGFVQGGTAPNADYNNLSTQIEGMAPYNPKDIKYLKLVFKY